MMQVQHIVERRKQMREEHESLLQQRQTLLMRTEVSVKKLCEAPLALGATSTIGTAGVHGQ